MKQSLNNLAKLQEIELASRTDEESKTKREELRAAIPEQILVHYDRLMARGKKDIAPVRDQICSGCHMRVPLAVVMTLKHKVDLQLCDNCGRYLYLPAEEVSSEPQPKAKKKWTAKQTSRQLS